MRTLTLVSSILLATTGCATDTEKATPQVEHHVVNHAEHDDADDDSVTIGKDGDTKGVRIGGENGLLIGKDGDTKGVQIGGEKGVTIGKEE